MIVVYYSDLLSDVSMMYHSELDYIIDGTYWTVWKMLQGQRWTSTVFMYEEDTIGSLYIIST